MVTLMVYNEQILCGTRYLALAFSYPIVRAKLKSLCHVICLWPQQARALSLIKTISWTLSMISDVTASIGHPEECITCGCMTTFKFIHPIVYSRWCRCAMKSLSNSLISFGLNLWYVDVWCMKLVFFRFFPKKVVRFNHLQKWNLANEFRSKFDSNQLRDAICQKVMWHCECLLTNFLRTYWICPRIYIIINSIMCIKRC